MLRKISIGSLIFLSLLKFFTFSYYLVDDPTGGICIAPNYSLSNHRVIENPSNYLTVLNSENTFIGENLYHFLVSWGWWFVILINISLLIFPFINKWTCNLSSVLFCLFTGITWLGILFRIKATTVNYVGFNYLNLQYIFLLFIIFFIGKFFIRNETKRYQIYYIIMSIISIIFLHLLHYWNILLPYEVWIQRGMPI